MMTVVVIAAAALSPAALPAHAAAAALLRGRGCRALPSALLLLQRSSCSEASGTAGG